MLPEIPRSMLKNSLLLGLFAIATVGVVAVTQQGTAAFAPAWVNADHGHPQAVVLVQPQPANQLIGQAGLASASGAGNPHHRYLFCSSRGPYLLG